MIAFNWLSTFLEFWGFEVTIVRAPIRSPYSPMFFANDCTKACVKITSQHEYFVYHGPHYYLWDSVNRKPENLARKGRLGGNFFLISHFLAKNWLDARFESYRRTKISSVQKICVEQLKRSAGTLNQRLIVRSVSLLHLTKFWSSRIISKQ